jgi:hypothetical protein
MYATNCHGKIRKLLVSMTLGLSCNRVVTIEPSLVLEWNSQLQATVGNADQALGGMCGVLNKACMCNGPVHGDLSAELSVFKGNLFVSRIICLFLIS